MRHYRKNEGDHILFIGTGAGGEEITREEYEHILSVIRSAPTAEDGYQYRLKMDLTWELVEAPVEPVDDEISDAEALDIILGGEA